MIWYNLSTPLRREKTHIQFLLLEVAQEKILFMVDTLVNKEGLIVIFYLLDHTHYRWTWTPLQYRLLSCHCDKTPDTQFKERRVSVGSQAEDLVHLLGKSSWQIVEWHLKLGIWERTNAGTQLSFSFSSSLGASPGEGTTQSYHRSFHISEPHLGISCLATQKSVSMVILNLSWPPRSLTLILVGVAAGKQ